MYENSVHPIAQQTWLRLTLAAFVLVVFTAGGSGVARADDGTSSQQSSSSQSDSPKSESPKSESLKSEPTTSDSAKAGAAKPDSPQNGTAESVKDTQPTDTEPTAQKADPPDTAAPVATTPTPPVTTLPARTSHDSKPTHQADDQAARPVAKIAALDPAPSQAPTRTPKPTVAPAPEAESTATGAAIVVPSTQPNPVPTIQPRLDLQLAGLAVDVATVTVSVVHTAATIVAQAFGPSSFLGVPYLLAMSVANAAAAVGRTIVGAPLMPSPGRFAVDYGILDGLAFFTPTKPPAGANDPSITVTPEHPLPIILLNGTTGTQGVNWSVGAPVLANAGYKVYTFDYGNTTGDPNFPIQATGDIRTSGLELAAEVDRVLAETGAPKVILVGHSQGGGILPVYYINELGGADKVSQLIGISPSNHGTDFNHLIALQALPILGPLVIAISDAIAPALYQQAVGSPFQQQVYGTGDTRPGVLYTTIATVNDEVVTPYTQQALSGPNVTNIVLQEQYPGLVLGHANIFTSPQAFAAVLDALASNPAASVLPNAVAVAA